MQGLGSTLVAEGRRRDVDPRFVVAVAWHESNFGDLNCQRQRSADIHNAWGIGAYSGTCFEYPDWRLGIQGFTWNMRCGSAGYLNGEPPLISVRQIGPRWSGGDRVEAWITTVRQHFVEMGGIPDDVTFPFPVTLSEDVCQIEPVKNGIVSEVGAAGHSLPTFNYTVRMDNIDDVVTMYINDLPVYRASWGYFGVEPAWRSVGHQPGASGVIDITSALATGSNTLRFELWNRAVCCGVSLSVEVSENDEVVVSDAFSIQDSTEGVKYDETFTITVQ
jgi:hypothetical protein